MGPKSLLASLATAGMLLTGGAHAQGNPSSDQIIRSLQPGAGMLGTTRGIRPLAPAPTPAEPAPMASAPPAVASAPRPARPRPNQVAGPAPAPSAAPAAAPSVNLTVQFATNSAELTPAAARTLDELGRALSSPALAAYRFRIEGHTDTVGSPDANRALSERRAATVVEYLSSKFRVDRARLEAAGMGEEGLLVQTQPNTPEPRNRRVQVINLGA